MADADWEHESDYARYVLRGPSAEQLREKVDEDRKRAKEDLDLRIGEDEALGNIALEREERRSMKEDE